MATATVTVTVIDPGPSLVDDTFDIQFNTPTVLDVLANDSDPLSRALTIVSVTQPTNGLVEIAPDGLTVTFTPETNFIGTIDFTYEAIST